MNSLKQETKSSVYNINLNAPFSKESSGIREDVSTETGALVTSNKIFSLAGRNGMDLNLSVVYQNLNAKLYDEGTSSASISNSYGTVIAFYDVYDSNSHWLRTGSLQYTSSDSTILGTTTVNGENWIFNGFLQYPAGTSLLTSSSIVNAAREKNVTAASKSICGVGWSFNLPGLDVDGDTVYVTLPDGQTYIADAANPSGLKDYKFNDIYFGTDSSQSNGTDASAFKLRYANGSVDYYTQYGEILLQTDRFGNKITYYWTAENGIRLLTKIVDSAGRAVTVRYDNSGTYFKCGNQTVSLLKTEIPDHPGKYYLSSYVDAGGRKTDYGYSLSGAGFDSIGKTAANNTYANLTVIQYPSGFSTNYTYSSSKKNLGSNGYMDYFKVSQRWDSVGAEEYNMQKYFYANEPDGYPTYKASAIDPSYGYQTTVINQNGDSTQYFYNYKHLLCQKQILRSDTKEIQKTSYDDRKNVPVRVETSLSDGKSSYVKKLDLYQYDVRGNLISENHPEDPANAASTEYETTYQYDGKYNILLNKTYKQDKDTTIVVKYTLSDDKKSVIAENTISNGNSLEYKTYDYDSFGNLIKSAAKINADQWAVTKYEYSKEYGYAYPVCKTSVGVVRADGTKQDITERYKYDFNSGNLLSKTDGNGNQTTYTYDQLNRVLKETLPDGLCRTYTYDDNRNVLTATNATKTSIVYRYDPFGRLSSVNEKATGAVLATRQYDTRDNLTQSTDANGNQTEYTYDSTSRITSVTVHDKDKNLVSQTQVSYHENFADAYGNHYFKVTVTKKGTTGSYVTNYYYNSKDMLVKIGRVSGSGEDISSYRYDYLQNMVSETGYDGAATAYRYNALGKLLQKTDAEGGTTSYAYDGLGKRNFKSDNFGDL